MKKLLLCLVLVVCGCENFKQYGGVKYNRISPETRKYYTKLDKKVNEYSECIKSCSTYLAGIKYCATMFCEDKLDTAEDRYVDVKSVFIYDFRGYITKVGNYPIDNRISKDCPKSAFCQKVDDLFICGCFDYSQGDNEVPMLVIDRRGSK